MSPSTTARRSTLSAELLRVTSPSAEVQGHSEAERKTVGGKRNVTILSVDPVGNYAVRLGFDDMHSTGIYSWAFLRDLGSTPSGAFRTISTISRPRASTATGRACADAAGCGLDGDTHCATNDRLMLGLAELPRLAFLICAALLVVAAARDELPPSRSCAAMAGRCGRWRFPPTDRPRFPAASIRPRSAGR